MLFACCYYTPFSHAVNCKRKKYPGPFRIQHFIRNYRVFRLFIKKLRLSEYLCKNIRNQSRICFLRFRDINLAAVAVQPHNLTFTIPVDPLQIALQISLKPEIRKEFLFRRVVRRAFLCPDRLDHLHPLTNDLFLHSHRRRPAF